MLSRLKVPPVTGLDAQQSWFPLGPQVLLRPTQERGPSQAFVAVLQFGVGQPQSVFEKHATHFDVVPMSLHFGVVPAHAEQLAPQLASTLQSEHTPAPPHSWLLMQAVSVAE